MTQNLLSVVVRHQDAHAAHCQLQQLGGQVLTAALMCSVFLGIGQPPAAERSADGRSSSCQEPLLPPLAVGKV